MLKSPTEPINPSRMAAMKQVWLGQAALSYEDQNLKLSSTSFDQDATQMSEESRCASHVSSARHIAFRHQTSDHENKLC